jgi:hypothetical protein
MVLSFVVDIANSALGWRITGFALAFSHVFG